MIIHNLRFITFAKKIEFMLNLKGKHAIVTGGGTGIGRSIALHLAKEGCNLILTGLGENDLVKVKEECEALGVKAWAKET